VLQRTFVSRYFPEFVSVKFVEVFVKYRNPIRAGKFSFLFLIHSCNNEATIRCCRFLQPSVTEPHTVCIIQVISSEFIFYLELSGFMSL